MIKKTKVVTRSFFDCLKNIVNGKNQQVMEDDISAPDFHTFYSPYMIQRYISMAPEYRNFIKDNQVALESLDNESHYRFLMKVLPRRSSAFIPYIKKKKKAPAKKKATKKGA